MYRREETLTHPLYTSAAWRLYTEGLTVGFLDLETTGLSRRRDHIILGGLLRTASDLNRSDTKLIQLLCDHPGEEKAMLTEFWNELKQCQVIVTYNGETFDLSFLKQRFFRYGIVSEEEMPLFLSVDLYRVFQNNCPMASLLSDLRQKTVEDALGLTDQRTDRIDGAESVTLYEQYAAINMSAAPSEKDSCTKLGDLILLHNSDDIIQLTRLMKILDKVDFHTYMNRKGFLILSGDLRIKTDRISLTQKELCIEGDTWNLSRDLDIFTPSFRISHNSVLKRLTVRISLMYLQDCIIADLETLPGDYSSLMRYPGYESGYLILHQDHHLDRAATNHMIKVFLSGLDTMI
ncbi:MAG: ribonuclease H-like domain-containing protein [Firmicutes bacterium]|nr:ribonuclease H-like domain-containing protein [Bacillota bacterium]